ncbi:MAG: SlyX family protein [Pirellulaceae bacterium]|nr:SlyX family protein [Pirellulaceae bacterium]
MSEHQDLQERVTKLEELNSHQELLLQQLHQVVLELRTEHEQLRTQTKLRIEQLVSQAESRSSELDPDEKPPHY